MSDMIACTLYCRSQAIGEALIAVGDGTAVSSAPLRVFPAYAEVRSMLRELLAPMADITTPEGARRWTDRLAAAGLELRTADNLPLVAEGLIVLDGLPDDADPMLLPPGPVFVGGRLRLPAT